MAMEGGLLNTFKLSKDLNVKKQQNTNNNVFRCDAVSKMCNSNIQELEGQGQGALIVHYTALHYSPVVLVG